MSDTPSHAPTPDLAFLSGGGTVGAPMRSHDWSGSPLGAPTAWPQPLRSVVGLVLASKLPMFVAWGDELGVLYNEAYAEILGTKHPRALGARLRDVWGEIWPDISPLVDAARAGEASHREDLPLVVNRQGSNGPAWFTVSCSPVRDTSGAVAGLFCVCIETTRRVLAERGLTDGERDLHLLTDALPVLVSLIDADERYRFVNRTYQEWFGRSPDEIRGRRLREVLGDTAYERLKPSIDRALGGERFAFEDHVPYKDGGARHVHVEYVPRVAVNGGVEGYYALVRDIGQRREAEKALQASIGRAEALAAEQAATLGQLAEGVIVTDPAGRITFVNEAAARIHGVARLDVEPDAYSETYHLLTVDGQPYPSHELPLARAVRDGETVLDAHWRIRRPDGSEVLAIGSARPVLDAQGGRIGAVLTLRDDTARDATERRLRENEARLRALTDNLPAGMVYQIATGRDGSERRFLYVSQSHERLTGIPAEAVLADSSVPYRLLLPEHRQAVRDAEAASIRDRRPFDVQVQIRRADGQVRWCRIISAPREQPDGSLIWDGLQIDVTDQKRAEALLRELNEGLERRVEEALAERKLWADVFESSDALIGALGPDHRFLAVNRAYADEFDRIYGVRPRAGDSLPELLGEMPEHRAAALAVWDRALAGEEFTATEEFGDPDRARPYYELRFNTLRDEAGRIIGAFQYAVDVTERLRNQARLVQAEEQLRQSQKMEAVGQLTGGIAHDFNNMLAVVVGSLDLLGRRVGPADARAKRYVDAAMDGARRAALLTQRLLAFSRQQPLRPEPVDANSLVAGMSDLLRHSLGPDVRLETVLAGGLWRTHADPNQLENVILNLAVNARDAMPDGGRLTVETQNAHLDSRYAAAHLGVAPGQYVLIAVTDTGTGMAETVVAKAFDPFFTTKEVGRGTGLGLSQVYGFVKQSGGHVKIYSELGQGTTVKVYLPRHLGVDGEAAGESAPEEVPLGEPQEVVLVVEDEPAVRRFSVEALTELGYRVLEAEGGPEALRLLDAHPEVALMFTDVVMPEVNGAKLAQEARRRRPDLRILFTTGYTRNAVVHNGTLDPGVELIGKPFTIEELAAKVREVLDRPGPAPAG